MKYTFNILYLLLGLCITLTAQEDEKQKYLIIETGLNYQSVLETRFTTNANNYLGFHSSISLEKIRANRTNNMAFHFSKNMPTDKDFTYFSHWNWSARYSHLRKLPAKTWKVGGYVDQGNAMSFSLGSWSENNVVSYTFWLGAGLAIQGTKAIQIRDKKFLLDYAGSIPVLSYVIRPAYAHPYPETYLKDGTFDFTQKGMWKSFFTAGKWRTLDSFMNFKARVGVLVPAGKKSNQLGIHYAWEYLHVGNDRPVWQAQHRLSLTYKISR